MFVAVVAVELLIQQTRSREKVTMEASRCHSLFVSQINERQKPRHFGF